MKATLIRKATIAGLILGLMGATGAIADDAAAKPEQLRTFKGTITSLNEQENTIMVDGLWSTKTFNTGASCAVSMEGNPESLASLHPGLEVEVGYEKLDGVLIAKKIDQKDMTYDGRIASIDTEHGLMEVKDSWKSREFNLPKDCSVVLHDDQSGSIENLHTGQRVNVIYENPPGKPFQARTIEETDEEFAGTIRAIDADARTVKAKTLLNEKKFNLADDCKVVVSGGTKGTLKDLQIGDHVEFSYEEEDGVLVANLIRLEESTAKEDTTAQVYPPAGMTP